MWIFSTDEITKRKIVQVPYLIFPVKPNQITGFIRKPAENIENFQLHSVGSYYFKSNTDLALLSTSSNQLMIVKREEDINTKYT